MGMTNIIQIKFIQMKKTFSSVLLTMAIASAIALVSCSSDNVLSESIPQIDSGIVNNPFAMSVEDAANDAMYIFNRSINARSASTGDLDYSVKTTTFDVKVESLSESQGKEIRQQVPVYSISYKDHQGKPAGFVLTIGDERVANKILAYSEEGEDFDLSREDGDFWKDRFEGYIYNDINNSDINNDRTSANNKVETRLAFNLTMIPFEGNWYDSYPYNVYTPIHYTNRMAAGSTAGAMSKIMAYNRWPQQGHFKRYTTDTPTPDILTVSYILTNAEHNYLKEDHYRNSTNTGNEFYSVYPNAKEFIHNILAECSYRLNADFSTSGSVNPVHVPAVFAQMGYYTDGISDYTLANVRTDIEGRGYLIFMSAWPSTSPPTVFVNNHSYIIRGVSDDYINNGQTYVLVVSGGNGGNAPGPYGKWINSRAFSHSGYVAATDETAFPNRYSCKLVTNIRKNPSITGCVNADWRADTINPY
jgi:hypothetical protein